MMYTNKYMHTSYHIQKNKKYMVHIDCWVNQDIRLNATKWGQHVRFNATKWGQHVRFNATKWGQHVRLNATK